MTFRDRALALLTAAVLLHPSAAFAKKKNKKAEDTPTEAPAAPAEAASSGAAPQVQVSYDLMLLDAGAEPRAPLRLVPTVGVPQELEMVMDMGMHMAVGDQVQDMDLPPLSFGMRSTVDSVDKDGTMNVSSVWLGAHMLEGGSVPPEVSQAMLQGFSMLEGLAMTQKIDATGRSLSLQLSSDTNPEVAAAFNGVQDSMRQSQVYLPAEPVGAGARWKVTVHIVSNGIPVDAMTTYTLRERHDDVLSLGSEVAMSIDEKAMTAAMPPGSGVSMDRFEAAGTGDLRWDLRRLFPTGKMGYEMHMSMSTPAPSGEGTGGVTMDMSYSMEMKAGDSAH